MSEPKWKHRPCPCGCGEMADECMNPRSALNAFQITARSACPCGATFPHGPHDGWDATPLDPDDAEVVR